jgi:hypothetical protein
MTKQKFNPKDHFHLSEYSFFLQNKKWKNGCSYELEWPYMDIPNMIRDKIINEHLNTLIQMAS